MQTALPEPVLGSFGLDTAVLHCESFGTGLIHHTFILKDSGGIPCYVLQQVNQHVFRKPLDIAHNLEIIGRFLRDHQPGYLFTLPIRAEGDRPYVIYEGNYYRLFAYVPGSHSYDICASPRVAFEAARQFGRFTAILHGLQVDMLRFTIPGFHDLSERYRQFEKSLQDATSDRLANGWNAIQQCLACRPIVDTFEYLKSRQDFKLRVTHHDTKISNVLFNKEDQGLCVIDLDTVMPGYFISDVGDMMRTYLSPVNEESHDLVSIEARDVYFDAIARGYLESMIGELSPLEIDHFVYAGQFMTYMQALRFLTDYLNNDIYYGSKYEGHNLARAENQLTLLNRIKEREGEFIEMVKKYVAELRKSSQIK